MKNSRSDDLTIFYIDKGYLSLWRIFIHGAIIKFIMTKKKSKTTKRRYL